MVTHIRFTKMQGLGNDFVVIDARYQAFDHSLVPLIADRHYGVGCDQLLLIEQARSPGADFCYRIFNADGQEVAQCGNGARCVGWYIKQFGLMDDPSVLRLQVRDRILTVVPESADAVQVEMGSPLFDPQAIPFASNQSGPIYQVPMQDEYLSLSVVNVGNPHAILRVDDFDQDRMLAIGKALQHSAFFPDQVNVNFVQVVNAYEINLRVYERGVGLTKACGSGACASVAIGVTQGWLGERVTVSQLGGDLVIDYSEDSRLLHMTGAATVVFQGEWPL